MRVLNIFAILITMLTTSLAAPLTAAAATYYVSNPSDPANKANRALLASNATVYPTLQAAAAATQPGDTVLAMNGSYFLPPGPWANAVLIVKKSGSPNKPITFMAYPGHHPIVTTAGNLKVLHGMEIDASWITISGFEVIGKAKDITRADAAAVSVKGVANFIASKTIPFDVRTDGNCITINRQTHVTIDRNLVHDCSASGIGAEMSDYIAITHNEVYNTSWWTQFDTSGINIHRAMNSDANTGYKFRIIDNISHHNGNANPYYLDAAAKSAATPTDGNGIIIDLNQQTNNGKPYLGRTLIMGNILYQNGGSGAHAFYSAHIDFLNNTAYLNNSCPVAGSDCGNVNDGQIFANVSDDIRIYNNIMVAPPGKFAYANWKSTNDVEDYNLFGALPIWKNYKPAAHDIVGDPMFVDPTKPVAGFRLQDSSPARGAGIKTPPGVAATPMTADGNVGSAINIGALSGR